ncbi:ISxcC1 transposase, partial [Legionella drozanskii LLAP-1]
IVQHLLFHFKLSERVACKLAGLSRSMYRYQPKSRTDNSIRARLKELATQYPADGYLLLHGLLKAEGFVINKNHTYRLYTEEGLQVRTKKRKKLIRPKQPMELPTAPNQRWSMDFVSDQLSNGRRFRVLNVVDDYSREMLGQLVSTSISGQQVARFLGQLIEERSKPSRSFVTMALSLPARQCSSGVKKPVWPLGLFSLGNPHRTLLWKV